METPATTIETVILTVC